MKNSPRRSRTRNSRRPRFEHLEGRRLLACNVTAVDGVLSVRGDATDNEIFLVADSSGNVKGRCVGAGQVTEILERSIQDIQVVGGRGNDDVTIQTRDGGDFTVDSFFDIAYRMSADLGGGDDELNLDFNLARAHKGGGNTFFDISYDVAYSGGSGNDQVRVTAADGSDTVDSFFDITYRMAGNLGGGDDQVGVDLQRVAAGGVDTFFDVYTELRVAGGSGNDGVKVLRAGGFEVDSFFDIAYQVDMGGGDDHVATNVAAHRQSGAITGGGDDDTLTVKVEQLPVADPAIDTGSSISISGGRGRDAIGLTLAGVVEQQLAASVRGNGGADRIAVSLDQVSGSGAVKASANGGGGSDAVAVFAAKTQAKSVTVQALGGAGADQLAVVAADRPAGDAVFQIDGGRGRDECFAQGAVEDTGCEGRLADPDAWLAELAKLLGG